MRRRPPRSTRTDTRFPYTTLFRSLPLPIRKVFFRHGAVLALCGNGALCLWQAQDELVGVPHIEAQYAASEQPVDAIHTGEIDQRGRGLFLPLRQRQCLARLETRSEERRVGKEGVRTCRSRGSPYN